ncbi:hypothetical protein [uncultured Sphingomonas sp.]|uniref:hypothetical protein n=1 Tax=uncultured Sphingomonas sp. TaxID=158754 RepID=UPI0035CAAF38
MVLDIGALWTDQGFVAAAGDYVTRGGREAGAIGRIGPRQAEIVLRAPLRLDEIATLSRPGDFDSLAKTAGATQTRSERTSQTA